MKKFLLSLFFIIASVTMISARDIIVKDYEALPQKGKEFIAKYYSNNELVHMKIDDDSHKKEYEVVFKGGIRIEFNELGEWEEIKSKKAPIPSGVFPSVIANYLANNYPQNKVLEIEKKSYGYELKLDNRKDLIFDKDGSFKKIDH